MRGLRLLGLGVVALAGVAHGQVWEKLLAPGLTYRMELDTNIPRMIHALRWTPKSPSVTAVPELAGGTVYEQNASTGRETVSQMARRTGAIAALNADFFPFTGDPLGLMIRNGDLLSLPFPSRIAFGWGKEIQSIRATGDLSMNIAGSPPVAIPQLNEECKDNSISLNSERAGYARSASQNCTALVLRIRAGEWRVGGRIQAVVDQVLTGQKVIPIDRNSCVLTGIGTGAVVLSAMRPGTLVDFNLDVRGFDGSSNHVVSGGPNLVSRGLIATDGADQGFRDEFVNKRHPRTAIGKTTEGDVWFVTIDGRQALSDGATIDELARVMQRLGCMEAINLDGGGSSALNVFGLVMNRPSEGKEREVANGVVFYGSPPPKETGTFTVSGPATVVSGSTTYFKIVDDKKQPIPNSEVLWSATGSGWIDQGGFLRATAEGTVFVSAFVRGQVVPLGVAVTAKGGR